MEGIVLPPGCVTVSAGPASTWGAVGCVVASARTGQTHPHACSPRAGMRLAAFDGGAMSGLPATQNHRETAGRRRRRSVSDGTGSFRPDIEGLRAVAVLLVVLDHLVGWPSGGFVGVDVFFVISGFLITGLLVSETARKGRISFRGFYARRARRILPAALTVLLAVTVAARLAYPGTARAKETEIDALWALGFGANVHFSRIGTDYFETNRAPSLVQHFWSLAVEEQFYLIWPVVILVVLTLLGRLLPQRRALLALLAVVGTATVLSFALGVHETATSPATAYFSTPVRAWELGVGALVALASTCFPGLFARLGSAGGPLSLLGLAGVLAGAFVVSSASGFPAPGAALPVLAAAIVIIAGIGAPTAGWDILLTNPVSRYLGRISYSLYLIHWPVLVLVGSLMPTGSWLRYPISILATMGLSMASYHFVETPFRKFSFRRPSILMPGPEQRRTLATQFVASFSMVAIAFAMWTFVPTRTPKDVGSASAGSTSQTSPEAATDSSVAQPSIRFANDIDDALNADNFPTFNPPLDQLAAAWAGLRCRAGDCSFGGGGADTKTAVVIGDSYALAWIPTIEAALPSAHWKVYGLASQDCPAAYVSVISGRPAVPNAACDQRHQFTIDKANSLDPDLVILGSSIRSVDRLVSKAKDGAAIAEYQAGMVKTIKMLNPGKQRRILTITAPPTVPDLQSCVTVRSVPADCVSQISPTWRAVANAEKEAAAATHTSFIDTRRWFCSVHDYCPSFIGATPLRVDGSHLTPTFAKSLGPELAGVIEDVVK